jgi:hypothetical protein
MGSFDCARASLREVLASLRMTRLKQFDAAAFGVAAEDVTANC